VSLRRYRLLAAGLSATVLIAPATASARVDHAPNHPPLCGTSACTATQLRQRVVRMRQKAVRLRDARGLLHFGLRPAHLDGTTGELAIERSFWQRRLTQIRAKKPLWRTLARWEDWMCIHGREGAWNDPGGTYHGGLQMDSGFMATYGPDLLKRYGTADHWPPAAQVAVAERAYHARGFTPWPNTARACGVL
jgi:Transglycosylase-like domain